MLLLLAFMASVSGRKVAGSGQDPLTVRAHRAAGIARELAEAAKPHLDSLTDEDRQIVGSLVTELEEKAKRLADLAFSGSDRQNLRTATEDLEELLSEIIADYRPGSDE